VPFTFILHGGECGGHCGECRLTHSIVKDHTSTIDRCVQAYRMEERTRLDRCVPLLSSVIFASPGFLLLCNVTTDGNDWLATSSVRSQGVSYFSTLVASLY